MCAFDIDNPHIHSCICLLGMFEGDRCQYAVSTLAPEDEAGSTTIEPTTHGHRHHGKC